MPLDLGKVSEKYSQESRFVQDLRKKVSSRQRTRLQRVAKHLDKAFLLEKAELIRDNMEKILAERGTSSNELLQRNVWASMDAIALHLDYSGFTRVFQEVAPKIFQNTRMNDPNIVSLEWQLICDYLGGEEKLTSLGLRRIDVDEVFKLAEKERSGHCGLPNIKRKNFTFKESFAKFCGRPDDILEVSHHSAPIAKIVAIIVVEVIDVIAGIAGALTAAIVLGWLGIALFIVSTVIVIIVACIGC